MLHILVLFSLFLLVSSAHGGVVDFCVANLSAPQGPEGYSCKPPAEVTADDFVYSGLNVPGNYSTLFNANAKTAFVHQFPALNGHGIATDRNDIAPGGAIPLNLHPGASETIFITEGSVTAGFISSDNTVYMKTLNEGDLMVFPQGLMHFLVNTGEEKALVYGMFSSPNHGLQGISEALFGSNLPSEFIEKITLIDANEARRLKALFGGSG